MRGCQNLQSRRRGDFIVPFKISALAIHLSLGNVEHFVLVGSILSVAALVRSKLREIRTRYGSGTFSETVNNQESANGVTQDSAVKIGRREFRSCEDLVNSNATVDARNMRISQTTSDDSPVVGGASIFGS